MNFNVKAEHRSFTRVFLLLSITPEELPVSMAERFIVKYFFQSEMKEIEWL